MSYDENGLDVDFLQQYDEDAGVGHIRAMVEEIQTDEMMEFCYETNGFYNSVDAATWSAEEGVYTETGHVFELKDFVPCENRGMCGWCPCNIEEKRKQD